MKQSSLSDEIRKGARATKLILPNGHQKRNWPLCLTCGRDVDSCNMENVNNKGCDLRAHCHGQEDSVHVSWTVAASSNSGNILDDKNIDWQLKRAMADTNFFDPTHIFGKGLIV